MQVEFVALAAGEQPLGDLEAALLLLGVLAGDAQARLGGAQGEVGIRHLGTQQHQHVLVVGFGGEVGGIGRLDGAAEAAPEVQLPADVEAQAVLPEVAVLRVAPAGLVAVEVDAVGRGLLQLWVAAALGDAQLGARFHHPQAGDLQAGVVGVGLGDQPVEQRIVEDPPPFADVQPGALHAGLRDGGTMPLFDPGLAGRLEVRAQAHAAAQAQCAEQQPVSMGRRGGHGAAQVRFSAPAPPLPGWSLTHCQNNW
ncbi:hypothetical protein D3C84_384200 [compost metagenome]